MPKKTTTRKKKAPIKLKAPRKPVQHKKRYGVRSHKDAMTDLIEAMVSDVPPEAQLEIVEHLCDIGIELLGMVTGVDATNAMIAFPDDSLTRLVELIAKREVETQVPYEDIIEGLIKHLASTSTAMVN